MTNPSENKNARDHRRDAFEKALDRVSGGFSNIFNRTEDSSGKSNGTDPFFRSVRQNNIAVENKKADPKKPGKNGALSIGAAINYGRTAVATLLATRGGYVRGLLEDGRSLLHPAAEKQTVKKAAGKYA